MVHFITFSSFFRRRRSRRCCHRRCRYHRLRFVGVCVAIAVTVVVAKCVRKLKLKTSEKKIEKLSAEHV